MIRTLSWVGLTTLVLSIGVTAAAQTLVGPGETLPVTASTAEHFVLNGGTLAPTNVALSGLIDLPSSSSIIRPKNPGITDPRGGLFETSIGPTNLNGAIHGAVI